MVSNQRVRLLLGTRKGIFFLESDAARERWQARGPFLPGWTTNHVCQDPRDGAIYAASFSFHYGPLIAWTRDEGETWQHSTEGLKFGPVEKWGEVKRTWHIEPGRSDDPDILYCGVEEGGLFRSEDRGLTWKEVTGLSRHPSRGVWTPGFGGLCLHSIALDPNKRDSMYVAISAAGTFRTDDGGGTWRPCNKGVRADFLPNPEPDVGQ
jgi:hypothetical protein